MDRYIAFILLIISSSCWVTPSFAGAMNLNVGEHKPIPLELGRCVTQAYETGNLVVQASLTGQGEFEGQSMAVFLNKSNPFSAASNDESRFQEMEIWFVQLDDEEMNQSVLEIRAQMDQERSAWENVRNMEIMKKYELTKGMSAETINGVMAEQQKAFKLLKEEKESRQVVKFKAFGGISVSDNKIKFVSDQHGLRLLSKKTVSAFEALKGMTTLEVDCAD